MIYPDYVLNECRECKNEGSEICKSCFDAEHFDAKIGKKAWKKEKKKRRYYWINRAEWRRFTKVLNADIKRMLKESKCN